METYTFILFIIASSCTVASLLFLFDSLGHLRRAKELLVETESFADTTQKYFEKMVKDVDTTTKAVSGAVNKWRKNEK